MTDSTHTPGPWIWRGMSGSLHRAGDAPYTYGDTVLRPEYEYECGLDTVVSEADANLIASSPELLGALKSFLTIAQHCEIKSGVCGCGEEMQGHADPYSAGHSPTDMADQVVSKAIEAAESAIAKAEGRS